MQFRISCIQFAEFSLHPYPTSKPNSIENPTIPLLDGRLIEMYGYIVVILGSKFFAILYMIWLLPSSLHPFLHSLFCSYGEILFVLQLCQTCSYLKAFAPLLPLTRMFLLKTCVRPSLLFCPCLSANVIDVEKPNEDISPLPRHPRSLFSLCLS